MKLPLLIGGATTSRQHTAVKIAPAYSGIVAHVLDASRAVNVVSSLLDTEGRKTFAESNLAEQKKLRTIHANKQRTPLVSLEQARGRHARIEWRAEDIQKPEFVGTRLVEDQPLGDLVEYIDWTFFFAAWELRGKFPRILEHPEYGAAARDLYDNAKTLLRQIIDDKLLRANAVYGFWPAASEGDDIVLFSDESQKQEIARFNMLRQQAKHDDGPCRSLADFVAPVGSGLVDYVGAFAVTAGLGEVELSKKFEADNDDYDSIMVKALADRLAEAFAEELHQRVRREWGYGAEERMSMQQILHEDFRGIRPAFGYPACPDHTEKEKLFRLLQPERAGITYTEGFAMIPPASVSGLYLSHPKARYFNVGRIGRDQVTDYAKRKGMKMEEAERWLAPNLGYDPEDEGRVSQAILTAEVERLRSRIAAR